MAVAHADCRPAGVATPAPPPLPMPNESPAAGATRRGFLQSAGALAGTPLIPGHALAEPAAPAVRSAPATSLTLLSLIHI